MLLSSRSEHDKSDPLKMIVGSDELDARLDPSAPGSSSGSVIDISDVDYLKHDGLLFLLAIIVGRRQRGLTTRLRLPADLRVLRWMRDWGFPSAVELAIEDAYESLFDDHVDSLSTYFAVGGEPPEYLAVRKDPDGKDRILLPRDFFTIDRLSFDQTAADVAWDRSTKLLKWQVSTVLQVHLGRSELAVKRGAPDPVGDELVTVLANDVVYETVFNAASRGATLGFTSSQIYRHSSGEFVGQPKELEIAVWDNGPSLLSTLRETLDAGESVQSAEYPERGVSFRIVRVNSGVQDSRLVSDEFDPDSDDAYLTASAFLRGITSDPWGHLHHAGPLPGMGLFYVRNAVIDEFGGRIRYMHGRDRFSLEMDKLSDVVESSNYLASFERLVEPAHEVAGNLIILSIPLKPAGPVPAESK